MSLLAATAIFPAAATLYFFVFWHWFEVWRRHRAATLTLMLGTFVMFGVAIYVFRAEVLANPLAMPVWLRGLGWVVIALACVLGFVADRQIGIRVRSFAPFFDDEGRIELETTGAYGIVRHPIYAAGIWYQLGAFLVTGYVAVIVAWVVFGLGAIWFTRQEERRLVELLADPRAYDRYRSTVPALLPWPRPSQITRG